MPLFLSTTPVASHNLFKAEHLFIKQSVIFSSSIFMPLLHEYSVQNLEHSGGGGI
jgi:hypothetical protein